MGAYAEWSGSYPCLCSGEWSLYLDGINVSDKIPKDLRTNDMGTFGEYQTWYFNEDFIEEFETYTDGFSCDEWIEKNKYWLDGITTDEDKQKLIFLAIQKEDFRENSCGGCI